MSQLYQQQKRILLTSTSSDSHTWNLVYLQLLLEENSNAVINLGACVPDAMFLESVRCHKPDVIVVSSVNGHGHLDGSRMIRALRREQEGRAIPAIIGGKLGILGDQNDQHNRELLEAGFTRVFSDTTTPETLITYLDDLPVQQDTYVASVGPLRRVQSV